MRAFDLLAKAEQDIRNASHPRYHFEMVLLRWMHLRKLVPLTELMEQLGGGGVNAQRPTSAQRATAPASAALAPPRARPHRRRTVAPPAARRTDARARRTARSAGRTDARRSAAPPATRALKDALLAEIRAGKAFFYNTVVAQAQRIDVTDDAITFTFLPTHRALREQFEQTRAVARGRRRAPGRPQDRGDRRAGRHRRRRHAACGRDAASRRAAGADGKRDLKAEAMSSSAVQAMLDVFPAEIRDVEEM